MAVPPQDGTEWIAVAAVLKPHGLRGTFRLKALTRDAFELVEAPLEKVWLRSPDGEILRSLTVGERREMKGIVHAKFEEIRDRTDAEQYTGCTLVIPESELWELPEGAYYADQLAGIEAVDAETGARLGVVVGARDGAAHDFLVLNLDGVKESETLLPMVPEFVKGIDIEARVARLTIPEGLTD